VLRYVERNPLRAGLVDRAGAWPWSSLRFRARAADSLLSRSPVALPRAWRDFVGEPLTAAELEAVRTSVRRESPYGDPAWARGIAERLGLLDTLIGSFALYGIWRKGLESGILENVLRGVGQWALGATRIAFGTCGDDVGSTRPRQAARHERTFGFGV
jgi:hypothetical protein